MDLYFLIERKKQIIEFESDRRSYVYKISKVDTQFSLTTPNPQYLKKLFKRNVQRDGLKYFGKNDSSLEILSKYLNSFSWHIPFNLRNTENPTYLRGSDTAVIVWHPWSLNKYGRCRYCPHFSFSWKQCSNSFRKDCSLVRRVYVGSKSPHDGFLIFSNTIMVWKMHDAQSNFVPCLVNKLRIPKCTYSAKPHYTYSLCVTGVFVHIKLTSLMLQDIPTPHSDCPHYGYLRGIGLETTGAGTRPQESGGTGQPPNLPVSLTLCGQGLLLIID